MRLAVILHTRCNEDTEYKTLCWIPDEWTKDDLDDATYRASKDYLAYLEEYKKVPAPNNYYPHNRPKFEDYPDKTVAEVNAIWEEKKVEWEAWNDKRTKARKTFISYLEKYGVKNFWEFDFGDEQYNHSITDVDWGHHHGLDIDYSATAHEDLPGPEPKEKFPW